MISAFILYCINIQPTHGYAIQRFLQLTGMEQWAKIQSGSIYYALTKLEKQKFIEEIREERTGSRVRKIFGITASGKQELHHQMLESLDAPISSIGSMKFFVDPILNTLSKQEITAIVTNHITRLSEQKKLWEEWMLVKIDETASKLDKITFQMTIDSLEQQITWHQELLDNQAHYIAKSKASEQFIRTLNVDNLEVDRSESLDVQKLKYAEKLKNEIIKDPKNAVDNLDRIIAELQKQIKSKN